MSIINTVSLVNDRKDNELPKAKCITHVYETRFESWLWWGGRGGLCVSCQKVATCKHNMDSGLKQPDARFC